jgi:hypothetical protein
LPLAATGPILAFPSKPSLLHRMPDREEISAIEARIAELKLEHRDLDDVVQRLMQTPIQDQLQLQRLKKRKLLVKDQIAILERQLTPDIPA